MASGRARDNQRQRVYNADLHGGQRMETVGEIQEYVDRITRSRWWKSQLKKNASMHRRFSNGKTIKVKDGRGRSSACGDSWTCSISMPRWSRTEGVILHEVAHVLTDYIYGREGVAAHGPEFAKTYAALVKRWMGREAWEKLKANYKKHKVKYRVRTP